MRAQIGEEVHLQGAGELRRRSEGNVDVLMEHLRDVRSDTCIRFASSVCDTPSCFIRSSIRLKNAEPTLSIAFISFNQPSRHPQFLQPTLLTSRRTDLDPTLSQPNVQLYLKLLHVLHVLHGSPSDRFSFRG